MLHSVGSGGRISASLFLTSAVPYHIAKEIIHLSDSVRDGFSEENECCWSVGSFPIHSRSTPWSLENVRVDSDCGQFAIVISVTLHLQNAIHFLFHSSRISGALEHFALFDDYCFAFLYSRLCIQSLFVVFRSKRTLLSRTFTVVVGFRTDTRLSTLRYRV